MCSYFLGKILCTVFHSDFSQQKEKYFHITHPNTRQEIEPKDLVTKVLQFC